MSNNEQSGIDQAIAGSKPEKTEAAQSEDLHAITCREAQKAPVALSLVQLLAVGAFDGPWPQQPHERAPLLPKPYRQAGGSVLLLGTSLCIETMSTMSVLCPGGHVYPMQSGECSVAVLDSCGVEMNNALISGRAGGNLHCVLSDIEKMRRYFLCAGSSSATSNKSMTYNVFEAWIMESASK